jgi:hypothetical protein
MAEHTTWEPHTEYGDLSTRDRDELPELDFVQCFSVTNRLGQLGEHRTRQ